MNTFLPYSNFDDSVKCLDNKRLGKQRLECYQLIHILLDEKRTAWRRHPAFVMWSGLPQSLIKYFFTCCNEFHRRGFKENLAQRMIDEVKSVQYVTGSGHLNTAATITRMYFDDYFSVDFTQVDYLRDIDNISSCLPCWVNHPESISGFRSNLLRKDPKHYGKFGWTETTDLEYFWGGLGKLKQLLGKEYKNYFLSLPQGIHTHSQYKKTFIDFKLKFMSDNSYFKLDVDNETVTYQVNHMSESDLKDMSFNKCRQFIALVKECKHECAVNKILQDI